VFPAAGMSMAVFESLEQDTTVQGILFFGYTERISIAKDNMIIEFSKHSISI
jgi:hypothetical protein